MAMTYSTAAHVAGARTAGARTAARAVTSRPASAARPTTVRHVGGHVRLTQRGRLTIFLTAVAVCLLAVFGHAAASADAPSAPTEVSVHVVVSGETLWSVARSMTPAGSDVRDTIIQIQELNGISGSDLAIGQQLLLPVG